jgi:hypothetical protein
MAKEIFLLMADRYPAHPLAPEACRWLIRHSSSSEARRREELKQFTLSANYTLAGDETKGIGRSVLRVDPSRTGPLRQRAARKGQQFENEVRSWYEGALALGDILAAYGPLQYADPGIQFCLNSSHRALGHFEEAQLWYTQFKVRHSQGPWGDAAGTELWLLNRSGLPPKPFISAPAIATPPFLDGQLDEECWTKNPPIAFKNAVGSTADSHPTEAWVLHDANFLYLGLRCRHPEGRQVAPVKPRPRDADLRLFDRVSLLLDLDRDYSTCFHLQVDQRGCVYEDCWGDATWNPKWYVAVHSDATSWQIEAAIPLVELTAEPLRQNQPWACNLVRTIPGKGVQAFSTPADATPRLEGLGLLQFEVEAAAKMPAAGRTPP